MAQGDGGRVADAVMPDAPVRVDVGPGGGGLGSGGIGPARGLAVQSPVRPEIVFFSVRRKRSAFPWVFGWLAPRVVEADAEAAELDFEGDPASAARQTGEDHPVVSEHAGGDSRTGEGVLEGVDDAGPGDGASWDAGQGETGVVNTGPRGRDLGARPQKSLPRDAGGALVVLPALTGWTG